MPLMTVATLIEQLQNLDPEMYVGIEGPDGALTLDIDSPKAELYASSVTPDDADEDWLAFNREFSIYDFEWTCIGIRLGHTPAVEGVPLGDL